MSYNFFQKEFLLRYQFIKCFWDKFQINLRLNEGEFKITYARHFVLVLDEPYVQLRTGCRPAWDRNN